MSSDRPAVRSRRLPAPVLLAVPLLLAGSALWSSARAQTADRGAVFEANCSMCHQLGALGVPGQFPRLAGRAGKIAATAAGRNYLEHVVLSGMIGGITVDGAPIVGCVMPSFSSLSDQDLAVALYYSGSLDDAGKLHWRGAVFDAADITRARAGQPLSPAQVHQLRATTLGDQSP